MVDRVCIVCNLEFQTKSSRRLLCSLDCSVKRNKERKSDWQKNNTDKCRSKCRKWYNANREEHTERRRMSYEGRIEYDVSRWLYVQLGCDPTPDLVGEATALRLLRRAIKKAGE